MSLNLSKFTRHTMKQDQEKLDNRNRPIGDPDIALFFKINEISILKKYMIGW